MATIARLRLPARLEHLPRFLATVRDAAVYLGFRQSRISEMELTAEEALVNIMHHAYRESEGPLEIICRHGNNGGMVIEVRDEGPHFDPLTRAAPDVTAPLGDRPVGGLGVLIMKELADDVSYERQGDANVLTLSFSPPQGSDPA